MGGLLLSYALIARGQALWLIPVAAGFPLIAPLTAVGLCEVSRRREAQLPVSWRSILSSLRGREDQQVLMLAGLLFIGFSFWMGLAHGIFAIFAESMIGAESQALLTSTSGIAMLAVGSLVGALVALAFYSITIVSLPMMVDRDVDFITAIIVSLATMRNNKPVMLAWALLIALSLFVAMLPLFLGLLVVLPVLGHATWHLYQRVVTSRAAA